VSLWRLNEQSDHEISVMPAGLMEKRGAYSYYKTKRGVNKIALLTANSKSQVEIEVKTQGFFRI